MASPLRCQETSVQSPDSKVSRSENKAKIASGSKVFENVSKSELVQYKEHMVISGIGTPTAAAGDISTHPHPAVVELPPVQEHSVSASSSDSKAKPLSSQSESNVILAASPRPKTGKSHHKGDEIPEKKPRSSTGDPLADKKKHIHGTTKKAPSKPSTDEVVTGAAEVLRTIKNATSKLSRPKSKPLAEEPQTDENTETEWKKTREYLNLCLMSSLTKRTKDALVVMKWLSGSFESTDLDPEGSVSESMATQRLEFHHIEVLQGLKAADWELIRESGQVAYRLFEEFLDSELDTLKKDENPRRISYEKRPPNTRLIHKFWGVFRTIIMTLNSGGSILCEINTNTVTLAATHPGAALQRVILALARTVISIRKQDLERAKTRCTKLFDDIGVLETHEKAFSAQMKTVAHLMMAGILRKSGENVEARFYMAQVRQVKDVEETLWFKWASICLDKYLDLKI
ncbi:uncharacterized protein DFL_003274 [Arthrobotrys flagrans]|uniref:Uncharacterized protein n=1 Tax=Arthrobotrys flagrans TaxID=97331 RepID=A0A437A1D5_ARTFL|nr:hypothetical protein DFL_003274 [Arthrobotrys flagrans]